jgi:carbamoyl-phosphate synthase small subunit
MKGYLYLEDGKVFEGVLFGSEESANGEVVFTTSMYGYEQSLTDPSFKDQILCFTYPIIGNYSVPTEDRDEYGMLKYFESDNCHLSGVIVSEYSKKGSHYRADKSFDEWLKYKNIVGLSAIDTRDLTKYLRDNGSQRGQIIREGNNPKPFSEIKKYNDKNLVSEVSIREKKSYTIDNPKYKVAVFDFGIKNNIIREFLKRKVDIHLLPWDFDIKKNSIDFDGIFFSNGPGNPSLVINDIIKKNIYYALDNNIPLWGICMGNQILSLAIGGKVKKMKYGNRGVNQPCQNTINKKCIITSQNHGYEVDESSLPKDWFVSWRNCNDLTTEGIEHKYLPVSSVQFHPESCPGPEDANFLFDDFINQMQKYKK